MKAIFLLCIFLYLSFKLAVSCEKIIIGKAVIVGAFSILLPGANMGNFSTAGAYSLINKKIPAGYYFSNLITKKENLKKRDLVKLNKIYKKAISNKL